MSAWDEAAIDAVRAALWEKRDYVTAPDIMEALAPHLAARDAAVRAQACEAAARLRWIRSVRIACSGPARGAMAW